MSFKELSYLNEDVTTQLNLMGSTLTLLPSNQPCFLSESLQGAQCYAEYINYFDEKCLHYFNDHCFQSQHISCYYSRPLEVCFLVLCLFLYLAQFFVCLERHLYCYFCRHVLFHLSSLLFQSILLLQLRLDAKPDVFKQKYWKIRSLQQLK